MFPYGKGTNYLSRYGYIAGIHSLSSAGSFSSVADIPDISSNVCEF